MSKKTLLIVSLTGLAIFSTSLLYVASKSNSKKTTTRPYVPILAPVTLQAELTNLPVRLLIEKIKVNSKIESVGVNPLGEMDTPKNFDEVAWFKSGVRPAEVGSAVITGHYGRKNNKPSVFDNLSKLKIGDTISILHENGSTTNFIIKKISRYAPKADAREIFISNDGIAHLNLITCDGAWNKSNKSYASRLVIFTDMVN